jgi:hypothetical protein
VKCDLLIKELVRCWRWGGLHVKVLAWVAALLTLLLPSTRGVHAGTVSILACLPAVSNQGPCILSFLTAGQVQAF